MPARRVLLTIRLFTQIVGTRKETPIEPSIATARSDASRLYGALREVLAEEMG
jgi:hypothetical protein